MAYTKTVWETGDVITAAKLNNAEDGIEAAYGLIVKDVEDVLDTKAGDIMKAIENGQVVYLAIAAAGEQREVLYYYLMLLHGGYDPEVSGYMFFFYDPSGGSSYAYFAETLDEYPAID